MTKVKRQRKLCGFLLDTNVFNHVIEGKIQLSALPSEFSIFVTHVQRDELDRWNPKSDAEFQKKMQVTDLFTSLPDAIIPTETTVLGISVLGQSKLGDGEKYRKIFEYLEALKPKRVAANQADALIGEVALEVGLELVTGDGDLRDIVVSLGGVVRDLRSSPQS